MANPVIPILYVCVGDACSAARTAAEKSGAELVDAYTKTFPDGERYVRVEAEPRGRVAVAVTTGYPEPSSRVVEAMLLVEALRGLGAASVVAAPLYLPYSRQDRRFLRGEPVSVRTVLGGVAAAGAEAFLTVDAHKEYVLEWFPGPSANVDPSPAFASTLRPLLGGGTVYVIGPDRGAVGRARRLAEKLGAAFDYLEKTRDRVTGEIRLKPKTVDVEGATVILVDDIVSTGGTLAKAAKLLYQQGARRVIAAVTHCLLAGSAVERLEEACIERLVCANTVKPCWDKAMQADIGPYVASAAEQLAAKLHGYESEGPR
jgi:ribose-phosphate pyrophosphokinase